MDMNMMMGYPPVTQSVQVLDYLKGLLIVIILGIIVYVLYKLWKNPTAFVGSVGKGAVGSGVEIGNAFIDGGFSLGANLVDHVRDTFHI